ncbi:MAG: hypothetical protein E7Z62_04430 [Thermoplasmata archaeon]|nr:hypothetical protein [Thermoplasmata archaeon]
MSIPSGRVTALLVVAFAIFGLLSVPVSETDADHIAEMDGITVTASTLDLSVELGETSAIYFDLYNTGSSDRVVYIEPLKTYGDILLTFTESEDGSPGDRTYLKGGGSGYFRANISPSVECDVDAYDFSFRFRSHDPTNISPDESAISSVPINIHVTNSKGIYYAQADDVSISSSIGVMEINAGESASLYLDVKNTLKDRSIVVYVYPDVSKEISITFPEGQRVLLKAEELGYCLMNIGVDQYAEEDDYDISFKIMINDPERGMVIESDASNVLSVSVKSDIISDDNYNRFFGYFENDLPWIFGQSWFSALITMIAFVCLAYLIGLKLIPLIVRKYLKEDEEL